MLILYYWCIIVQGLFSLSSIQNRNRTFICPYSLYLTLLLQYTRRNICDITFFFVKSSWQSAKSGQITRREKMQKIVKIPVGLPVAPGITEIFLQLENLFNTQFFFRNLLKFSAVRTEFLSAAIVHIFSSIKSDDKIIKKWPPKPPPLKHKPHQISSLVEAVKTSPFFSTAGNLKCQTATEDGGLE